MFCAHVGRRVQRFPCHRRLFHICAEPWLSLHEFHVSPTTTGVQAIILSAHLLEISSELTILLII
jgi:hypothetical protein